MKNPSPPKKSIAVGPKDMPLACPMVRTNGGQPLWNQHPKVFLELSAKGEAHCPYCGTVYLWEGSSPIPRAH